MKRPLEFNLEACIGDYCAAKRPTAVAPAPPPTCEPVPAPVLEEAPEAQSVAQKMLHELINGPPPLLAPLAALQPQAQTSAPDVLASEVALDPRRHRHAGILREFGGVREWMKR
jgi:hypothetical protein